jgi:hypothetical protein
LPARFQTISLSRAAWLSAGDSVEAGNGQCSHCRTGNMVPATTPTTNTQGNAAEKRRRQGVLYL